MGEGMTTHSSNLAWRSPWTEEPGGLQSMGSQRVGHDYLRMQAHMPYDPAVTLYKDEKHMTTQKLVQEYL